MDDINTLIKVPSLPDIMALGMYSWMVFLLSQTIRICCLEFRILCWKLVDLQHLLLLLPALPLLILPHFCLPLQPLHPLLKVITTSYEPESQNNIDQPSDDASLYHNASISIVTSLLIMSFALKYNLTDAALQDLLQLISHLI